MLRCIRESGEKKGYPYRYPRPPYGEGTLFLENSGPEPVALIRAL